MTRPGPTPQRPYRAARAGRGLLAALVGALLVLAGIVVGAVPAAAQHAVGASTTTVANTVGSAAGISAGQRLGRTSPQPQIVVATAVAANTAAEGPLALTRAGPSLAQRDLEHIVERHWATSDAAGAGKFAADTTGRSLKSMIEDAVYNGSFRPNTMGRPGTIYEHDFGSKIGTDIGGSDTSWLRVVLREDNSVVTAFPFSP